MAKPKMKCILLPISSSSENGDALLPISLEHQECVILGRRSHGVSDKRISSRQAEATADYDKQVVTIKQTGKNPSWIVCDGMSSATPLLPDMTSDLQHSAVLKLLDTLQYQVVFSAAEGTAAQGTVSTSSIAWGSSTCLSAASKGNSELSAGTGIRGASTASMAACNDTAIPVDSQQSRKRPHSSQETVSSATKRGRVSPDTGAAEVRSAHATSSKNPVESSSKGVANGQRMGATADGKAQRSFFDVLCPKPGTGVKDPVRTPKSEAVQDRSATSEASWDRRGDILLYKSAGVKASSHIAAFDLDYTLIRTKSGKLFPTNSADWQWWDASVKRTLKDKIKQGYKIVIFTNQGGIKDSAAAANVFKQKIDDIQSDLKAPFQVFAATKYSASRKPQLGMWNHLVNNENCDITVDTSSSFYVGDAAGRPDNWAPGKKKDFSSSDREFAANIKMQFYTPEEFFLGQPSVPFKWAGFNPETIDFDAAICDDAGFQLQGATPEVIVMVGFPGSGKSSFCKQHLLPLNYVHVNRDTEGTWQKCVARTSQALQQGRSVVVDNTSPDAESRSRYVECARKAGAPARCFLMATSLEHAKHNNKVRVMTARAGYTAPNHMAYNNYRSKYTFPSSNEGFASVHMINFVPTFATKSDKLQYMQFLG